MKLGLLIVVGIILIAVIPLTYAGSPPPPPPPCPQKLEGCYDLNDIRKTPGSLTPEEFSFYMSETACLKGSCVCSLTKFKEDVMELDPDQSAGACACIVGTAYANIEGDNNCCGDDDSDCGAISEELRFGKVIEKHLCAMTSDLAGMWVPANPNAGDIAYLGCNNKEYLTDGENWTMCQGFQIKIVRNHEYLCTETPIDIGIGGDVDNETNQSTSSPIPAHPAWVECCGSASCNSASGGKRLSSGGSIKIGATTYYCLSEGKFSTNLDHKDKTSCEGADFAWTGSLCCSEADDPEEYYNDPEGRGGCWNKKVVYTGDLLDASNKDIVNMDGQFYGCNVQNAVKNALKDYHTQKKLLNVTPICFQDPNKFYLCQVDGTWKSTGGKDFSHKSTVPAAVRENLTEMGGGYLFLSNDGCCSPDKCWDGAICVDNQKTKPTAKAVAGYRCVDGNWTNAEFKPGPEENVGGFCPRSSQCLVSPFGNANDNDKPEKNPQCIADGQYIGPHYCENGIWTSRTKFVGTKLLGLVSGKDEFVVFCDKPKSVLNNLEKVPEDLMKSLTDPNANHFCVVLYEDKLIFGTTLTEKLETDDSILELLSINGCSNAFNNADNTFKPCTAATSAKAWYNSQMRSIIYSSEPFNLNSGGSASSLKELFNAIIRAVSRSTIDPFDTEFIDNIRRFEKLYMAKNGQKEIRGSVEGYGSKRMVIEYRGFDTNICDFVQSYNQRFKDSGSRIACEQQGSRFIILAEGSEFTKIDPEKIWNDLTSKLRIS